MFESDKLRAVAHNALRIAAGAAFFTHGGQKLFGWFGARGPVEYLSEYGVAGVLETVGGALLVLGLFVQPVAFIVSGEMAVTYFWKHALARDSLWWWGNRGELPLLYCFIWLLFAFHGAGSFSVDAWLRRRRAAPAGGPGGDAAAGP